MKEKGRVVDYASEILTGKGNRILIKADPGSGKSWFAINYLPSQGRTLDIASRKVIKQQSFNEALIALPTGAVATLQHRTEDPQLELLQQCEIQQYFESYRRADKYKFCTIDEIHMLLSDTFAEPAFYMTEFIKEYPSDKCLIMMSACADRVREFLEYDLGIKVEYIDLTEKTFGVKPKKVMTIIAKQAWARLYKANSVNRILYFCATTKEAYRMEAELLKLSVRVVAITSQPENRLDKDPELLAREEQTLQFLYHHDRFPDDVDVIISTSKLREGLNLHDTRIKTVISELKDHVSLIQCAGRVRHGVEEYCLVTDKSNLISYISEDKLQEAWVAVKGMNTMIDALDAVPQESELYERLTAFSSVKEKYGGLIVRFDDRFHVNQALIREYQYRKEEHRAYKENPEKYISDVMGMPVNPSVDILAADEYLQTLVGRKLSTDEKNDLISHLHEVGLEGKQLERMLEQTRFRYKHAPNYTWHMILYKMKSGFRRMHPNLYKNPYSTTIKLVSKRVSGT